MSWLYSQALVEEYLGENFSDGVQSAPLNGKSTQQAYCLPDKMKEFSRLSRSGMTYKPLTESRGKELLMLYLEDSLAKTLVQQGKEQELEVNDQACGNIWRESLAKYDQDTHSLKTQLYSDPEGLIPCSVILPHWGTMLNGVCYRQPALAQTIKEPGCGYLPTPTCHNAKEGAYPAEYTRKTPTLATHVGGKIHPEFTEWMMGWPLGWTDLKPLETDKFLSWPQAPGHSY